MGNPFQDSNCKSFPCKLRKFMYIPTKTYKIKHILFMSQQYMTTSGICKRCLNQPHLDIKEGNLDVIWRYLNLHMWSVCAYDILIWRRNWTKQCNSIAWMYISFSSKFIWFVNFRFASDKQRVLWCRKKQWSGHLSPFPDSLHQSAWTHVLGCFSPIRSCKYHHRKTILQC